MCKIYEVIYSGSRSGTRASVFYDGEFYDNVFVRLRGGYTTDGRKFEFNDGHHFRFDPDLPRVDEFNLNERGGDPTYIRQILGWETYVNAGQPGSLSFPMHVRRNGSYLNVRIFVEQPDRDLLRRNNLALAGYDNEQLIDVPWRHLIRHIHPLPTAYKFSNGAQAS